MSRLRVFIIENHSIVKIGVRQIVQQNFDCEVVSASDFTQEILQNIEKANGNGLVIIGNCEGPVDRFITDIRRTNTDVRILIFSRTLHYPNAINFLIAGANGFLTQNAPITEVVAAVTRVMKHERYLCIELLEAMAEETYLSNVHRRKNISGKIKTPVENSSMNDKLSKRQREIVGYLIKGESVSGIASRLNIKISTVGTHKSIVFDKLGVKNVLELIEMYYGDIVT